MKQQTITVRREATCYTATFHGDETIRALFGTEVLPTAFTAEAVAADVVAEIQRLNPGADVRMAPVSLP